MAQEGEAFAGNISEDPPIPDGDGRSSSIGPVPCRLFHHRQGGSQQRVPRNMARRASVNGQRQRGTWRTWGFTSTVLCSTSRREPKNRRRGTHCPLHRRVEKAPEAISPLTIGPLPAEVSPRHTDFWPRSQVQVVVGVWGRWREVSSTRCIRG